MIREGIRRAFSIVGGRRAWERDVEEEIKLHLSLRAEQLVADGVSPDEAFAEAVRRFGPLTESRARLLEAARHREQRMQRTEYFADLRQDLTFALRTLRRQKAWTAVTIGTLALGVGATTAVFSAVSSLLIHTLPYPGGSRIVYVYQQPTNGNNTGVSVTISPSENVVRAWKEGSHSFEAIEGFSSSPMELKTNGEPSQLDVGRASPSFLNFAGEHLVIGRMFTESDLAAGGRVALLGEELWRSRFGADSSVLGKAITLDDSLYTVIGVAPATLRAPSRGGPRGVWLPLDLKSERRGAMVVGRLRPGVSEEAATRELDSLYARTTGITGGSLPFQSVMMSPSRLVSFRDSLILLAYAVGLVLLIASANVAHLLVARSASRQRELAIRAALGAGRGRVFRQMLTESFVLSSAGTALGVGLGWAGLKTLVALRPSSLSSLSRAHVDGTTLALSVSVALVTGIVFGVLGVFQAAKRSTHDSLKSTAGRTSSGSRGRARAMLVVSEMALSAMLVVGVTMLVRSVIKMQKAPLGFEPKNLYVLTVSNGKRSEVPAVRGEMLRTITTRISVTPGIKSVALAQTPPSSRSFSVGQLEIDGEPMSSSAKTAFIDVNSIGSSYFSTMNIRLVSGTAFTDTTRGSNQVIINEGWARKQWHGQSPVGKRLRIAPTAGRSDAQPDPQVPWMTIVGVAADAATSGPGTESTAPFLYTPASDSETQAIVVRTSGSADVLAAVQALVRSIDPRATPKARSVEQSIAESIAPSRYVMLLLTVFTMLALVLAAVGLYGVMSYSVAERTREIGIRVALGATRARIGRSIVIRSIALAAAGAAIGMIGATWGTKLIQNQLYGVARSDIASFVTTIVVLVGVAVVACIVPTRRALAVDPMTAIRAE